MAASLPKIRFLIMNAFTVGGTVRTTFTMAGELAKRGHDVEIVSVYRLREAEPVIPLPPAVRLRCLTDLSEETLERLAAARDPVSRLRHWLIGRPSRLISSNDYRHRNFNLLTDVSLLRFLASVTDGILISTRPGLNLLVARLAPRHVVRVGQDHVNLRSYLPRLREQIAEYYPTLDMVTALTKRTTRTYREMLPQRVRVQTFPNAVPELSGQEADSSAKIVVAAGRLTRQKGFDRLLPAWRELTDRYPDWKLRIFGDGRERENLEQQIEELGIGSTVTLAGFTNELHEEFARASMYVMTSREEGFPMVLIEAMGIGLAAVSVDCHTGPRDIITDGVDGYLVPQNDRDALVAAMSDLMADAEKRRSFGAAARHVTERYEAGKIAARWERALAKLVAKKGPRRSALWRRILAELVVEIRAWRERR
ncbi:MAG TPA: glycosyltransferase family 4 protein [Solirubrobacteraceae bacterium]|nr:glycosyltransferase family 4 protein [Solirubrobacteraceae bacterium]